MKTKVIPAKTTAPNKNTKQVNKDSGNNPKKPGNDPDQTPEREIEPTPVANPKGGNKVQYI